jgi:hypothetical protein
MRQARFGTSLRQVETEHGLGTIAEPVDYFRQGFTEANCPSD